MEPAVFSEPPTPRTYENHASWNVFSHLAWKSFTVYLETQKSKVHQCGSVSRFEKLILIAGAVPQSGYFKMPLSGV
jgi:hypothetical protein